MTKILLKPKLRPSEHKVLKLIKNQSNGMSYKEIVKHSDCSGGTVSHCLRVLKRMKLVKQIPNLNDMRISTWVITNVND